MKELIEKKINEIAALLFEHIHQDNEELFDMNIGLYGGKSGVLLFLAYYMNWPQGKNKDVDAYEKFADAVLDNLVSVPHTYYTFCNGLAGTLSGLRLLNEQKLYEVDFTEVEEAYKTPFFAGMIQYFNRKEYDFMHGALGIALHFYDDEQFARVALDRMNDMAIQDGDAIKWISRLGVDRGEGINIALSHGMSSVVSIFTKIYRAGLLQDEIPSFVEKTVNYILRQEIDREKYGSCFASQSLENGDNVFKSRLAWCYGDLGVATSLWQAGQAFGRKDWSEKALDVMRFTARRKDLHDAMVNDAGVCHGSAGISMMFRYMYEQTGDELFLDTARYWIVIALKQAVHPDGFAGYKKYMIPDGVPTWENAHSMLEGIAGIGLVLLTSLDEQKKAVWPELFLLG